MIMRDYGMYSYDGELEVSLIVTAARELGWEWAKVQRELETLAKQPDYSEAYDTEVRESVYKALGFKTPFYI